MQKDTERDREKARERQKESQRETERIRERGRETERQMYIVHICISMVVCIYRENTSFWFIMVCTDMDKRQRKTERD